MKMGICPPSKPRGMLTLLREPWPFWPRPLVFPCPAAIPRPTRLGPRCAPFGGFSSWSFMSRLPCACRIEASRALGGVRGDAVDVDEVAHLEHHAADRRRGLVLDAVV